MVCVAGGYFLDQLRKAKKDPKLKMKHPKDHELLNSYVVPDPHASVLEPNQTSKYEPSEEVRTLLKTRRRGSVRTRWHDTVHGPSSAAAGAETGTETESETRKHIMVNTMRTTWATGWFLEELKQERNVTLGGKLMLNT